MAYTVSDYSDAMAAFHGPVRERQAVAHTLHSRGVPISFVQGATYHINDPSVARGNFAEYRPSSGSFHMPGEPSRLSNMSPGMQASAHRMLVHEHDHRARQVANPQQFSAYMKTPEGRGYLEASAENAADRLVPESFSPYDYRAHTGTFPSALSREAYVEGRGSRRNIDPRLLSDRELPGVA